MPYTYKSLAFAWLIIFALFAVSASGAAGGGWLVLLIAAAFALPALVLRNQADAALGSPERPSVAADGLKQSPFDLGGLRRARSETRTIARAARGDENFPAMVEPDVPNAAGA